MQSIQNKLAVSALALVAGMSTLGDAAYAKTYPLYGGGGTLAAKIYRQIFNCYGVPVFGSTAVNANDSGGTTPFPSALSGECSDTGSTTTAPYKAPLNATSAIEQFLYAPVGSGAGLSAFTTNVAGNLGDPASSNQVAFTTTAFAAYPYPALDFAGSDAALTTTQVSAITNANGKAAIQVPAFATPIALPFNAGSGFTYPSNFAVPAGGSSKLRLSIQNVCGIFTGKIALWNSSFLTNNNGGVALTKTSQKITVYVRADGSGTTAIFSNWLKINCASTAFPVAAGFTPGTTVTWPASFKTASGSGGIQQAIDANPYSIGYVSPDYVAPVVPTGSGGPQAANVINPLLQVVPPSSAAAGKSVSAITAPAATANAYNWGQPINNAVATESTTKTNYPTGAYPITGFTFLDFYQCYNGASPHNPQAAEMLKYFLLDFFLAPSGTQALPEMTALLAGNGFAQPTGAFRGVERTLVNQISHTGAGGTAACTAAGVTGING